MHAVYYLGGDVLTSELGSHPSQVWRAISASLLVLKQGLIRRVGDGWSINILYDNWLPRNNLLSALHPKSADLSVHVSDLIDVATKAWDYQKVHDHMQLLDVETVMKIPLSVRNTKDSWAWHYERSGIFIVRSA